MKCFPDGYAIRKFFEPYFKIPLNPPLPVYDRKRITKGG